jgi:formylglycine-generating enzyme required for sulfatase activity
MTGKRYRLLTEAEWEYAARAGTTTRYSWGDEIGAGNANCDGCGSPWDAQQPAPVGSFAPNPFGLHDMHGNVREWVEDVWHADYSENPPVDGSAWTNGGDQSQRSVRGGGWFVRAEFARSANRAKQSANNRTTFIGFRVARSLEN